MVGLSDLNKNTGCLVKSEFQMDSINFFSMCHEISGSHYKNVLAISRISFTEHPAFSMVTPIGASTLRPAFEPTGL